MVRNLGSEKEPAYEAYIPTLNGFVYGDSTQELEQGIVSAISTTIKHREKKGLPIPKPDRDVKRSGKLILRISPTLHDRLSLEAQAHGLSLNKYIEEKVTHA